MGFLYFVPGDKHGGGFSRERAVEAGLGYVFAEGAGPQHAHTYAGPEGASGFIVQTSDSVGKCIYDADAQTWRKIIGRDQELAILTHDRIGWDGAIQ